MPKPAMKNPRLVPVEFDPWERVGDQSTPDEFNGPSRQEELQGIVAGRLKKRGLQPAAAPADAEGIGVGDYTRSFARGLDVLGQLAGKGMQAVGMDSAGQAVTDLYTRRMQEQEAGMSPAYRAELAKPMVQEVPEGEGLLGSSYKPGPGLTSVPKILGTAAESIPSTAAGMALGGVGGAGLRALGASPAVAGAVGYGAGEAAIAAGMNAAQIHEAVLAMPEDVLAQSKEYQALLAAQPQGVAPEQRAANARAQLATDAAKAGALPTAITTFLLSAPAGAVFGKMLGGEIVPKTLLGRLGMGAGTEAAQEFAQSGAEQVAQNLAMRKADPNTPLSRDVLEQAVGGFVSGGLLGGGGAVLSAPGQRGQEPTPAAPIQEEPLPLTDIREVGGELQGVKDTRPQQPAPKLVPVDFDPWETGGMAPPIDIDQARQEGAQREYLEVDQARADAINKMPLEEAGPVRPDQTAGQPRAAALEIKWPATSLESLDTNELRYVAHGIGLGGVPEMSREDLISSIVGAQEAPDEGRASRVSPPELPAPPFRTGDIETDAALAKIGRPHETVMTKLRNAFEGVKGNIKDELSQGFFDQFHGLKVLDQDIERTFNVKLPTEKRSYIQARMSTGLSDTMEAVLRHGPPVRKEGAVTVQSADKGLLSIFKPLGNDLDLFLAYRVGVRADKLMKQGREHYFTQAEIDKLKGLAPKDEAGKTVWRNAWIEYNDYRRAVLDFAQDNGIIDPEGRKVWEDDDHIPFYRLVNEGVKGPRKKRGLTNQKSGIHTLKGGESRIGDPLGNIIMNFTHLIDASVKNHAADLALKNAEALGYAVKAKNQNRIRRDNDIVSAGIVGDALEADGDSLLELNMKQRAALFNALTPVSKGQRNTVNVLRNGKPEYYEVLDPLLLRSLSAINAEAFSGKFMRSARFLKRVLTTGVTTDPAFMAANLMRDTLSTWVVTNGKFMPVVDSAKGAVKSWREDMDFIQLQAAGGSFTGGYVYGHDPEATAKNIKRIISAHGIDERTILNSAKKLWHFWQKVGAAGENAARVAKFANMRKEGRTLLESAYEARDVMDFSMRGDWRAIQFLTQVVPFLGARIQGLHKLARGAAENPRGFLVKGGAIMAASVLLHLFNRDDDRYKQLEEWDRDNYYHFWVGEEHFRLPKPFEVGAIFGTLPERLTERFLDEHGNNKLLAERLKFMFTQTFAVDFPQIFGPLIEQWANKSAFTGRPIVGQSLERLAPGEQRYPWTSETASEVGKAIGVSPRRVEHLIRGYFGTLGVYILGVTDVVTRRLADYPEAPSRELNDMPVLSRFWRGSSEPARSKYATAMYDVFREVDQLSATLNYYRKSGDVAKAKELINNERDKIRYKKYLNRVKERSRKIDASIKRVYFSRTMSPDAKMERINELSKKKNTMLKAAYNRVYGAFE